MPNTLAPPTPPLYIPPGPYPELFHRAAAPAPALASAPPIYVPTGPHPELFHRAAVPENVLRFTTISTAPIMSTATVASVPFMTIATTPTAAAESAEETQSTQSAVEIEQKQAEGQAPHRKSLYAIPVAICFAVLVGMVV